MSNDKKPSSPLMDSLRLFIGNKPSVIAAIMLAILTIAAVTGQLYTGKMATDDQLELIKKAEIAGDVHGIKANPDTYLDSHKAQLLDTFISPGGTSNVDPDKKYYLGTDHLGRDVLARLWEGTSISLTIGLLSVSISLLLGISLGGIAGYFGRSKVRLPFLAMFILLLSAAIAWAADFTAFAVPLAATGAGFFVVQLVMAMLGKRYKAALTFIAVSAVALSAIGFVYYFESTSPEGRIYTQASIIENDSKQLILRMRDFGHKVKEFENSTPDAPTEEWMEKEQYEIEVGVLEVAVEIARFNVIENVAELEIAERTIPERKERIEHLTDVGLTKKATDETELQPSDKALVKSLMDAGPGLETALESAEKELVLAQDKSASEFKRETSNESLIRRAGYRKSVNAIYSSKRKSSFEAMIDAKLLNGHQRYSFFKFVRSLGLTVVITLILIVSMLAVTGAAQASASESKSILKKIFLPTISVDDMVMRFTEIMMGIPVIYLILMVLSLFEKDVYVVMAIIGLTSWMGTTRFVRAEILALREQDFVQAARALGIPEYRIIWRHLVPNALSPVLVSATLGVATAVLAESTLSFLGLGAGPDQNTWGKILSEGRQYMIAAGWLTWVPGLAILVTVLSFNMLGEGLREAFNPKLRGR